MKCIKSHYRSASTDEHLQSILIQNTNWTLIEQNVILPPKNSPFLMITKNCTQSLYFKFYIRVKTFSMQVCLLNYKRGVICAYLCLYVLCVY